MRIELNPAAPRPPAIKLGRPGLMAWIVWLVLPGWLQALLRIVCKHWMVWGFAVYVGYFEGGKPWPTFLATVLFFGITDFIATYRLVLEITPKPSPAPPPGNTSEPTSEEGTTHSYPLNHQPPQPQSYEHLPFD